ncbi:DMT family transporter [Gluconacetobacter sacchari]|uniref:DMT family transporter n=1 Tax=Gluconacetobacter sacchari TaxID=92759 RepID=UPI0039B4D5FF
MNTRLKTGVTAALFAAFTWSLNFISPFLIGNYSLGDLATVRFFFSGLIGVVILVLHRDLYRRLTLSDWLVTAGLGFIGYVGYFITIMIAAVYAGPIIPPAFLGLVPVILAIAGNVYSSSISWATLRIPFGLAVIGLILVNTSSLFQLNGEWSLSRLIGTGSAIGAVALWTWFGIANQRALSKRPGTNAWVWTAMMMIGGSIETLFFLPIGYKLKLFNAPTLGFGAIAIAHLYLPAFALAVIASIGGAWAWTVASQRLPMTLAGQLLTMEMVFATCFGLLIRRQWPHPLELLGIVLLLVGIIKAIGAFYDQSKSLSQDTERESRCTAG